MMEDFLTFIVYLITILVGFLAGVLLMNWYNIAAYTEPMNALGIERFQKCEIHTTNCHSNWYEIVWKKEKQK